MIIYVVKNRSRLAALYNFEMDEWKQQIKNQLESEDEKRQR